MEERMCKLCIHRNNDPYIMRKLRVGVNNKKYKLAPLQSVELDLPVGNYSVHASLDLIYKSNIINLELNERNQEVNLYINAELKPSSIFNILMAGLKFKNCFSITFTPDQTQESLKEYNTIDYNLIKYLIPIFLCLLTLITSWFSILPFKLPIIEQAVCLVYVILYFIRHLNTKKYKPLIINEYYNMFTSIIFLYFALSYTNTRILNLSLCAIFFILFIFEYSHKHNLKSD